MGKLLVVGRLAARDLIHRRAEAALLLIVIAAATVTLTMGLALSGVIASPYQQTRTATRGPDVVASFLNLGLPRRVTAATGLEALHGLANDPGVAARSGPYPVSWPVLRAHGLTVGVLAEGRSQVPAAVDQPLVVAGTWVRTDGVVVERSFAEALGLGVGDRLTLNGRPFRVAGIAVSAANVPYPQADFATYGGPFPTSECGMVWLTGADARSFATKALPLSYLLDLRLTSPASAPGFVAKHIRGRSSILGLSAWQDIAQTDGNQVRNEQRALVIGSTLLALLAVASVTVLVGMRMAAQLKRVGLLKAVGGTPRLAAAVLVVEHLTIALAAAAAGLAVGRLAAPLLAGPGAGLVGSPGAPSLTWPAVGSVTGLALLVALLATAVPAIRAARTSTVAALADAARPPRRRRWLIRLSRRLPVPLMLGLRLAGRRPRRLFLAAASVAVTVTTLVAVVAVHAHFQQPHGPYSALTNPKHVRIDHVLLIIAVVLVVLAAANAIFITWATVLDSRHAAALARALGATAEQVSIGVSAALLLPALAGSLVGIPAGIELIAALSNGGPITTPPATALVVVEIGTLIALGVLTFIAARIGSRRSTAEILQSETA